MRYADDAERDGTQAVSAPDDGALRGPGAQLAEDAQVGPGALRGTRVTVVGINYAPEPTGSAPYTAGLAEMLLAHGADVDVVTGVPHYPTWQVDPAYRRVLRARENRNGVRVHRARHFVPRRQTALSRIAWDATFLANAGLIRPSRRPDLVIASTPSLSGAAVGAGLARRYRVPFGVVVQDLVGQAARQSGVRGGGAVAGAAASLEARLLRRADRVAVVSDAFRSQLDEYDVPAERVTLLRNWTHITLAPGDGASGDRASTRRAFGWADDQFVVLHTGNMGLKQDLGNVVEAARLLAGRRDVLVVLMGDGNQREQLHASGSDVDVLRFEPPVAADRYAQVLDAADLLLVNERPSVGDMSLPSKLTSYFAAGRPVLAAVSDGGACARELAAADGAAVRVEPGEPALLAKAIQDLATDRDRLAAMGRAGRDYAHRVLGPEAAGRAALELARAVLRAGDARVRGAA